MPSPRRNWRIEGPSGDDATDLMYERQAHAFMIYE